VIEFPELQQALVEAAGNRRRRAPQLVRPVLIAAAACAIAIAAVLLIRAPADEEHVAAPAADPFTRYDVFRHPVRAADAPPSSVDGMPGLRADEVRLVEHNGPWRVYLVAGALDGRQSLCAFAVISERARFGCDAPGTVHAFAFPEADGDPGAVIVTVPDGIDEVEIGFPGRSALHAPVRDNAVLAPLNPWPEGTGTIAWDEGGVHHEQPLPQGSP
jgi:hypothetical protein